MMMLDSVNPITDALSISLSLPINFMISILCLFLAKQAVLWYTDTLKPKSTLEEHTLLITDVRFSPSIARLATSSFDKTVRVWDADNVSGSDSSFHFFALI